MSEELKGKQLEEENKLTEETKETQQSQQPQDEAAATEGSAESVKATEQAKEDQADAVAEAESEKTSAGTEAGKTETSEKAAEKPEAKESAAPEKSAQEAEAKEAPAASEKPARPKLDPAEREARRAAAAAAKAAKAAAAAGDGGEEAQEAPKEPSPKQPLLDKITELIRSQVAEDAVEEAYINEADGHLPVVVVKGERWQKTASLLKEQLQLDYLINLTGVDYETHMEVVYHIESFQTNEQYCVKVRTDRDAASVPSVTPVWSTANWQEREAYDLLGIDFPGHPDLTRIMMPDDWVGHPLRKDYEPLDPEV